MKASWIIAAVLAAPAACMAAGADQADAQAAQPELPEKALVRFGTARLFHGASVRCLSFTPDGREIVVAGGRCPQGEVVSIWSASTGRLVRTMAGPPNGIASLSLSGDGKSIVLAGMDRSLHFVSFPGGEPVRNVKLLEFKGKWVALSPNGSKLAISDGSKLSVIDLSTGKSVMDVQKGTGAAFSPDGRYLAVVSLRDINFGVEFWDVSAGVKLRRFETPPKLRFSVPAFSSDGRLLVGGSIYGGSNELIVWNALTGRIHRKLPVPGGYVVQVALSSDGKRLACADRTSRLRVWDVKSGKAVADLATGLNRVAAVSFSPDGRHLAAGGSLGQIHVWETDKFSQPLIRTGHSGPVTSVGAGDNGGIVATGGHDGTVLLWDGRTGRELHRLQSEKRQASSVTISRDGTLGASCSNSEKVRIWRTETGKQLRSVRVARGTAKWIAFLPGGRELVAIGTDGSQCIIDADTGKVVSLVSGGDAPKIRVSLADNAYVAASYYRSVVTAWELRTGRNLGVFAVPGVSYLYGLAVSPSGRLLAGDAGKRLVIMELDSGRVVQNLVFADRRTSVSKAAFSPDSRVLALADADWTTNLWDVRTGEQLGRLVGHRGQVTSMSFMPDGKRLLTGSKDGTAIMWDLRDMLAHATPTTAPAKRADLDKAWKALVDQDAKAAADAFYLLVDAGNAAVRVLVDRIGAVEVPDPAAVRKLIADLGHEQYSVRKRATEVLAQFGPLVEPALRLAESSSDVEEVRLRVRQLLTALDSPRDRDGEALRQLRAALVLEEIATPEAVALLKKLAAGSPAANLTRRATEVLQRIRTRTPAGRPSKDAR